MELKTYIQTLKLKINGLDEVLFEKMKDLASKSVVDKVKKRVVDTGTDANGVPFSTPYSKRWSKKRSKRGLDTSKKNFQYTGSMWNGFGVVKEEKTSTNLNVYLGMNGQNSDSRRTNQQIVNFSSDKEGRPIIEVSESEAEEITEELRLEVKKYLNVT